MSIFWISLISVILTEFEEGKSEVLRESCCHVLHIVDRVGSVWSVSDMDGNLYW